MVKEITDRYRIGKFCIFHVFGTVCTICHHLYNLNNMKNTHGRVILLVKLLAETCDFSKSNIPLWVLFAFFKLYK